MAPEISMSLTFQIYTGAAPPFTGVAVKVTEVPELTGFELATIETLAGKTGLTVMVTAFEVAGEPVRQGVALEVITTEITFPSTGT